jgi:putative SOS response-associated peptidase YedK
MPVILPVEAEDAWLSGEPVEACKLLTPYSGSMNLRAVSRVASNSKVDVPECLNDAEPDWGAQQELL